MALEAYTIEEFCRAHRFSRSQYFNMKKVGQAPREMAIGKRRVISPEAAAEWRLAREAAAKQEVE